MKVFAAAVIAALAVPVAAFGDDTYMDDRSSAETVVRSLYNAINAHEYARAWGYFAQSPAKDFETYQQGYAGTTHVDVLTGDVNGEGAAGSVYYQVPTAIRSTDQAGKQTYFAGCYTVRKVQAGIQDPPFNPLHIESAKLKPSTADDYVRYALPKCGDAVPIDQPKVTTETAKARFIAENFGQCDKVADTIADINEPQVGAIKYRGLGDDKTTPERLATLYTFSCAQFAYNESFVFYLDDAVDGLHRLSFAEPKFDFVYRDQESALLKSMKLKGFAASSQLNNAEFDPKTKAITSLDKWRGIGDASSSGTWVFSDGQFTLSEYAVDPTMDLKQNPIIVIRGGQLIFKSPFVP